MRVALATAAALIGLFNFFAFLCGTLHLGGDAANGAVVAGHYFVGSHGKLTEVSGAAYSYSQWHVRSLFVTVPLTFCGMAYLALKMKNAVIPKGRAKFRL